MALRVTLPPALVAVSVYVVVTDGRTIALVRSPCGPTPLSIENAIAFALALHDNVVPCPCVMVAGLAANVEMLGASATRAVAVSAACAGDFPLPVAVSV